MIQGPWGLSYTHIPQRIQQMIDSIGANPLKKAFCALLDKSIKLAKGLCVYMTKIIIQ